MAGNCADVRAKDLKKDDVVICTSGPQVLLVKNLVARLERGEHEGEETKRRKTEKKIESFASKYGKASLKFSSMLSPLCTITRYCMFFKSMMMMRHRREDIAP